MKKIAAKSVKTIKPVKLAAPKKAAKGVKAELNTDALEKPHMVPGKPHHFQYK